MKSGWCWIGLFVALGCAKPETDAVQQFDGPDSSTSTVVAKESTDGGLPATFVEDSNDLPESAAPMTTAAEETDTVGGTETAGESVAALEQSPDKSSQREFIALEPGLREHHFRLLLPTSAAPLIVDVEIQVDGIPLGEAFGQELKLVLQNAAGDTEDRSWRRLFEHVAANPIRFGNSSRVGRTEYRQIARRYDQNRNGEVEPNEAAKFLFRTSPHSTAFRMFGTDVFRGSNRSKSAIFSALDLDRDQVLNRDEMELASQSLLTLDQNADHRIDIREAAKDATDANDAWKRSRSKRWGDVAMDLTGHVDWSMLSYMIGDLDRPGPFGRQRNLNSAIDQDDNQSIDAEEAKQLLLVPPDMRLLVTYRNGGEATVQVEELTPALESITTTLHSPRQVGIVGTHFSLTAQVMKSMGVSSQFPDQAFAMFDINNDGGLDETEIPSAALREYSFEELDQDGDAKLTIEELRSGLADKQPIWFAQVRARGAESPDAVFAWLDKNHDRFLSEREIRSAGELIKSLAAVDGSLAPAKIPDTYLIQFGRGDPSQDAQLFAETSLPVDTRDDPRPRWAIALDANRDGDISTSEFTGTSEQFHSLDRNKDRFIDAAETASE